MNEKRRKKARKKFKAIGFNPNFWDNPLDTPVTDDGPFVTLDGDGPSESVVSTTNTHAIEIHEMLMDENFEKRITDVQGNSGLPVIFHAGEKHMHLFPMYEKLYGNYIILKDAVQHK